MRNQWISFTTGSFPLQWGKEKVWSQNLPVLETNSRPRGSMIRCCCILQICKYWPEKSNLKYLMLIWSLHQYLCRSNPLQSCKLQKNTVCLQNPRPNLPYLQAPKNMKLRALPELSATLCLEDLQKKEKKLSHSVSFSASLPIPKVAIVLMLLYRPITGKDPSGTFSIAWSLNMANLESCNRSC